MLLEEFTWEALKYALARATNTDRLVCPSCRGRGECYTSHKWDCYECEGTGYLTEAEFTSKVEQADGFRKNNALRSKINDKLCRLESVHLEKILEFIDTKV